MRARSWAFTCNNYSGLLDIPSTATYMVYQEEMGDSGTPHLQGTVCYSTLKTMQQVKDDLDCDCHLTKVRDLAASIKYCIKDEGRLGGPYIFGDEPVQGKRNDLLAVKESIDAGATTTQLWDEHFSNMIRYHKSFDVYKQVKLNTTVRSFKTKVLLIVGPAGMQKSTLANILAHHFSPTVYTIGESRSSGLYFDGYIGQDCVILDEMDGTRMKPTLFNLLCDENAASVPQLGKPDVNWAPHVLIICSNYLPRYWWKKRNAEQVKQTTRRIDWTVGRFRPCPYCPGLCAFHHP